MATVVLDIETIPVQDPRLRELVLEEVLEAHEAAVRAVRAPGNYKDQAKIDAFIQEARAKLEEELEANKRRALEATSLDGLGQVAVIGFALDDEPVQTLNVADLSKEAELRILEAFFLQLRQLEATSGPVLVVGHNIIGFDLPFLWKRGIILGARPPRCLPRDAKPWADGRTFDTMREWAGRERGGYVSLGRIARVLDIPLSSEANGGEVWALVQAGKMRDVVSKCRSDVEATREVYRRMTFDWSVGLDGAGVGPELVAGGRLHRGGLR